MKQVENTLSNEKSYYFKHDHKYIHEYIFEKAKINIREEWIRKRGCVIFYIREELKKLKKKTHHKILQI